MLFDQTVELADAGGIGMLQMEADLSQLNDTATVTFDGVVYECEVIADEAGQKIIGNPGLIGEGDDNGLPFMIISVSGMVIIFGQAGNRSVKIETNAVKTIDPRFVKARLQVNLYDEDNIHYVDRTFEEMRTAFVNGIDVIIRYGGNVFTLNDVTSDAMSFVWVRLLNGENTSTLRVEEVKITSANEITYFQGNFNGTIG